MSDHIDLPIRIKTSSINKVIRKNIAPIYPRAKLLGALKAHGRISFNHDEPDIRWRVRTKRHTPAAGAGYPNPVDFVAIQPLVEAVLPWRQYVLGEHIGDIERKVGRHDDTAFPRLINTLVKDCLDDFQHWMQRVPYKDGYAGAANDVHGLESIFKASSNAGKAVGTLTASTYAGQLMSLGALGGTWTGDWPAGDGSTEYCAWSNMVVDYHSTYWSSTTPVTTVTWPNTWQYALHFAHAWLLARQGEEPNICIMHPDLLRQAMDSMISKQVFEVTVNSKMTSLGIKTLNYNGLEVMEDAFCPADTAYLLNLDRINLWCMDDQLVKSRQQEDITTGSELLRLDFFGNMWQESPAYQAKLKDLT